MPAGNFAPLVSVSKHTLYSWQKKFEAERPAVVGYDRHLYKEPNGVVRFFGRVKQYRRVATRYDKKARNFLGFDWLAALDIMLA